MGAVYLIRHGQASFGSQDYDRLSELGREQARVLGEALRERLPRVDAVFSGTMRRHLETAEGCLAALGVSLSPEAAPGFREFDHEEVLTRFEPRYADQRALAADLAGATEPRRFFQEIFTRAVARWVSGSHDADYAEAWPVFRRRCIEGLDAIISSLGPSRTALVFTSGGPITAIGQEMLGIPDARAFALNWTLANCGVTKVIYSDRGRYLSTLNEHAHFEGARRALISYR